MKSTLPLLLLSGLHIAGTSAHAQVLPVTTASDDARRYFEQGRLAAFHYRFEHARAHLDRAIAADPEFALVHIYRGGSTPTADRARRGQHFDRAEVLGIHATDGERRMAEAFRTFLWNADHEGAVRIFTQLAGAYPDDAIIAAHIGLRYLHALERVDAAVEWFERARRADPSFAPAQNWLGFTLLRAGRTEEGERVLRESLLRWPDDPYTHDFIGETYLDLGRVEDATRLFRHALQLDSSFDYARNNLARVEIAAAHRRMEAAFDQGDASAVAAAFTGHGALLSPGGGLSQGTEEIRRYWDEAFARGLAGAEFDSQEVLADAADAFATEVGRYRVGLEGGGADQGRYVGIWLRTSEGLKLHRSIWTSSQGGGQ
jgi:tetratricopeptide (TPR) repeat protein